MTQHALPSFDTYNGDVPPWSDQAAGTVNIYESITDLIPTDPAFIDSNVSPSVYVTKLSTLLDPGDDTNHTMSVRALRVAAVVTLTTELRQGYINEGSQGTLIESFSDALTAAFVSYAHTVTNANMITDYSNLYLRFSAPDLTRISWAELEVPDFIRRAQVQQAYLEVPYLQQETVFIENRIKRFNENLLLSELAVANLLSDVYFGGGFTNDAGNQFKTWDPATLPKPGFISGDLRFTYSFLPTVEDRTTIDAILDAHDGDSVTGVIPDTEAPTGSDTSRIVSTIEVNLGSLPRRSGRFTITGITLTIGKPVLIQQANGPYTNKGTRADEAEMDHVIVSGKVISATVIECFWKSPTWVKGKFKFDCFVGG